MVKLTLLLKNEARSLINRDYDILNNIYAEKADIVALLEKEKEGFKECFRSHNDEAAGIKELMEQMSAESELTMKEIKKAKYFNEELIKLFIRTMKESKTHTYTVDGKYSPEVKDSDSIAINTRV